MTDMQMSKHDHILMGLISSLQAAAMQQMGKIPNSATGAMNTDLKGAASTIDLLEMLKAKCRQDTPESLLRFMDGAVMELQMSFVDARKKENLATEESNTNPGAEA